MSTPTKNKAKEKEREKENSKGKEPKARAQKAQATTERLKTVVRRLPPNLPEEVFWQSVQPWVSEETVTWKEYHQGKFRKRLNKENIFSRAYIAFKTEELLATFSKEYDGHLFRDKAGNESIAVVEWAPFQKVPPEKKKLDARMGTIEQDEDYISFLESLKDSSSKPFDADTLETLIASRQPPPMPTTTPLLEALKAEKSAQKDKEAILRNHAHYKDASLKDHAHAGPSKREDAKKKGAPASNAAPKVTEPAPSKRAAKKAAAASKAQAASGTQPATKATPAVSHQPTASGSHAKPQPPAQAAPKAPRAHRERQGSKGAASAPANVNTTTVPPVPTPAVSTSATTPTADASASNPSQPGARRARPTLGLASRQFEAALSGAVGGKSRREREKDKDAASQSNSPSTHTSPKSRPRPVSSIAAATAAPPTILQRDGQGGGSTRPDEGGGPSGDAPSGGRGGRGRGRGRGGRGRGG